MIPYYHQQTMSTRSTRQKSDLQEKVQPKGIVDDETSPKPQVPNKKKRGSSAIKQDIIPDVQEAIETESPKKRGRPSKSLTSQADANHLLLQVLFL